MQNIKTKHIFTLYQFAHPTLFIGTADLQNGVTRVLSRANTTDQKGYSAVQALKN